jgi:hypothetical protein
MERQVYMRDLVGSFTQREELAIDECHAQVDSQQDEQSPMLPPILD